jgi:Ca-activated chloride channel family protein
VVAPGIIWRGFRLVALPLLLALFSIPKVGAQTPAKTIPETRILFLLDASQSMYGVWHGERKYMVARQILSDVLDSLATHQNIQVALRVYGHLKPYPPQDCNDTRLEVPFGPSQTEAIKKVLSQIKPKGTSPIAMALERTENDFPPCSSCRNIVILITDGLEECGGDICEVSARLQQKNIFLKPYILGLGQNMEESYDCAGYYFNAENKVEFSRALNIIITKILNKTSLQVNLLDAQNRPTETNVNLTFVNSKTNEVIENYIHTLNSKGVPDTLNLDPDFEYNIVVNTLPPVVIEEVSLTKGQHNIVAASTPRGGLQIALKSNTQPNVNPAVLVYLPDEQTQLNIQYPFQTAQYLQGNYRVQVLTLPVTTLENVNIEAGKTTQILIDNPGILSILKKIKGYGSLYVLKPDGSQEWVVDINSESDNNESYYLQPGTYKLVFRPRFSMQSIHTKNINFNITSFKTTRINL